MWGFNPEAVPTLLVAVLVLLVAAVGVFNGWGMLRCWLDKTFEYLASKTKLNFLRNVDDVLVAFAQDLYRSEIRVLKRSGGWNDATKARMLNTLRHKVVKHFGRPFLTKHLGVGRQDMDEFLASRCEAAVTEAKLRGRLAKGPSKPSNGPDKPSEG